MTTDYSSWVTQQWLDFGFRTCVYLSTIETLEPVITVTTDLMIVGRRRNHCHTFPVYEHFISPSDNILVSTHVSMSPGPAPETRTGVGSRDTVDSTTGLTSVRVSLKPRPRTSRLIKRYCHEIEDSTFVNFTLVSRVPTSYPWNLYWYRNLNPVCLLNLSTVKKRVSSSCYRRKIPQSQHMGWEGEISKDHLYLQTMESMFSLVTRVVSTGDLWFHQGRCTDYGCRRRKEETRICKWP